MNLYRYQTREEVGIAAGKAIENKIIEVLTKQSTLRMIFAAAPSQSETLAYLKKSKKISWERIVAFHMDEYIGLSTNSSALFSNFLKAHLFDHVPIKKAHYLDGLADSAVEILRYSKLLREKPIDIVCLGIGENGHIAFNDPPVADFKDDQAVKKVMLDYMCRQQQVNDGCFSSIEDVPKFAITLTIPLIISGSHLFCMVPGKTKKEAVNNTVFGPIATSCPSSIMRTLNHCDLFVDQDSLPDYNLIVEKSSRDVLTGKKVLVDEKYGFDVFLHDDIPVNSFFGPGLVDLQINGINGIDFNDPKLTKEDVLSATKYLLDKGVTLYCPTLITNSKENIFHLLKVIREACEKYPLVNFCVLGIHLEGPFISSEDGARGAHSQKFIIGPSIEFLEKAIAASKNRIAIITLAPELENMKEFILACTSKGIKVAIGHSMASSRVIKEATLIGLSMATHLGNAIPLTIPRHPNIIWDILAEDKLFISLIADGFHVPDEFLKVVFLVKGDKSFLVSDATSFAGLPPGDYDSPIGGKVFLDEDGKLSMKGSEGLLAGSSKDLLENLEYLVNNHLLSISAAWKKASIIPFCFIKGRTARLKDKVVFEKDNKKINVLKVYKDNVDIYHQDILCTEDKSHTL